ncbi:xanthine dehydrogenase family protein subunit M [Sphingobium sp. EM0848]|uniref:FAD binding domain-containing protein n=1 Tax=Sphingobium sp. EM0848 TaxID=2743473 RepID=UPI00159C958F|nr:xanthine dehydrogenase family protein subunit M [Sphingobium sp. EM0848]
MYSFAYHRDASIEGTCRLRETLDNARFLAGGQSLLPMMKLRFAAPENIIDLRDLEELRGIKRDGEVITIGALTRHADVARSALMRETIPAIADLAGWIGDPMVRAQGTLGGSVANNDPAACYPSACLALGARIHTTAGEIEADDFFLGVFETALTDGALVTAVEFPVPDTAAYVKFRHPASRFALAGVFVARFGGLVRVGITGAGQMGAYRWIEAEEALTENFSADSLDEIKTDISVMNSDIHADAEYRAHLVEVMTRRAVKEAITRQY